MSQKEAVDLVNRLIRERAPDALAALAELPTCCMHDERLETPLNTAIRVGYDEACDLILREEAALEYCPDLDKETLRMIGMIASQVSMDTVEATEEYVAQTRNLDTGTWQRTPLLQACRYENRRMISELIALGARLNVKDALRMTPFELCLEAGEGLPEVFIDACAEAGARFPVSDTILKALAADPALSERVLEHGKLSAAAKRHTFCLACARLDIETVTRMLDGGFDVNSAISNERHPAFEAATSYLVWALGLPDFTEVAAGMAHMYGHPHAISISDKDLVDDEGNAISFAAAEAKKRRLSESVRSEEMNPRFMSPGQVDARLRLLDVLADAGLDAGKRPDAPIGQVTATNEPRLMTKLTSMGFRFDPEEPENDGDVFSAIHNRCYEMVEPLLAAGHRMGSIAEAHPEQFEAYEVWRAERAAGTGEKPAVSPAPPSPRAPVAPAAPVSRDRKAVSDPAPSWELGGESVLFASIVPDPPLAGEEALVRLTHSNVYGPVDGVEIHVRLGDPHDPTPPVRSASGDGWIAAELVEELVHVGDTEMLRAEAEEPFFEEMPWSGTFEATLSIPAGRHRIEIRLSGGEAHPELVGVIDDWLVEVA